MIETQRLCRRFGRTAAVDELDLEVREGEVYGFLGPNGAGKTTTLRMLAGLLRPSSGAIRIDGKSWERTPRALRKVIGFVPETPPLFDYLTGRQYIALVAGLFGVERSRRDAEADRLLAALELDGRADEPCRGLSHGMRRKVHLVAVLVTRPKVLLLDEPSTGLDPRSVRALKDLILECRDGGTTVLLSTHVLDFAEELSDRVGVLAGGRLRAVGTVAELRATGGEAGATLERIFLQLTDESDDAHDPAAAR